MITRINAFATSDGKIFEKIEEVQKHEISKILGSAPLTTDSIAEDMRSEIVSNVAAALLTHKDRFIDILTTTARSKPKARAINGGRKTRTLKSTPQPAAA